MAPPGPGIPNEYGGNTMALADDSCGGRELHAEAQKFAALLPRFEIRWIPREQNKRADLLARYAARLV